jgi:hypothetical protein
MHLEEVEAVKELLQVPKGAEDLGVVGRVARRILRRES